MKQNFLRCLSILLLATIVLTACGGVEVVIHKNIQEGDYPHDCSELGDINGDGVLNVLDVVILTNFILETDIPDPDQFEAGDINGDSVLNILDVVNLVNLILG